MRDNLEDRVRRLEVAFEKHGLFKPPRYQNCLICGDAFRTDGYHRRNDRKYCGDACRTKAARLRKSSGGGRRLGGVVT